MMKLIQEVLSLMGIKLFVLALLLNFSCLRAGAGVVCAEAGLYNEQNILLRRFASRVDCQKAAASFHQRALCAVNPTGSFDLMSETGRISSSFPQEADCLETLRTARLGYSCGQGIGERVHLYNLYRAFILHSYQQRSDCDKNLIQVGDTRFFCAVNEDSKYELKDHWGRYYETFDLESECNAARERRTPLDRREKTRS